MDSRPLFKFHHPLIDVEKWLCFVPRAEAFSEMTVNSWYGLPAEVVHAVCGLDEIMRSVSIVWPLLVYKVEVGS